MPSFTFEKISPPVHRGPIAAVEPKPRGVIVQILDRIAEARVRRRVKPAEIVTISRDSAASE